MEALTRHQVVLADAIEDDARVLDAALLGGAVGPLDDPRFRVRLPLLLEGRHAEVPQRERRLSDTFKVIMSGFVGVEQPEALRQTRMARASVPSAMRT